MTPKKKPPKRKCGCGIHPDDVGVTCQKHAPKPWKDSAIRRAKPKPDLAERIYKRLDEYMRWNWQDKPEILAAIREELSK